MLMIIVFLIYVESFLFFFFFFQAEDGIRDTSVTGVQTCALPIFSPRMARHWNPIMMNAVLFGRIAMLHENRKQLGLTGERSEERRVGKECRCRWWREH